MIIVIMGPPGAGKGTQAEYISKEFNLDHLSTGDLVRFEIKSRTETGLLIQSLSESGKLVPDEVILNLLKAKLNNDGNSRGYIFDGFPRTIAQAEALYKIASGLNQKIVLAIELNVELDYLVQRLTNRFQCATCGENYNKLTKEPKQKDVCDVCGGGNFIQRADDNPNVIEKRFNEYKNQTEPLINYFSEKGVLKKVNAQKSIADVKSEIANIMKNVLT